MTDAHHEHVAGLISTLEDLIISKYEAGVKEHGGQLWEKKGLIDMAIDEAVDQVVYLLTLKQQIEASGVQLGERDEN